MINEESKRIGIFGGSFNPIHMGHLIIAEYARFTHKLDKVIFVPAKEPPHKYRKELAPSEHRYNMVDLAIGGNSCFEISREELDRQGPSYSVDTLLSLSRKRGADQEFFFILGADAVLELLTWKSIDKVMKLCCFLAATRPGYSINQLQKEIKELPKAYQDRIVLFEIPRIDISATCIRSFIKNGRSIKYLVPDEVEKYIRDNNLYL